MRMTICTDCGFHQGDPFCDQCKDEHVYEALWDKLKEVAPICMSDTECMDYRISDLLDVDDGVIMYNVGRLLSAVKKLVCECFPAP